MDIKRSTPYLEDFSIAGSIYAASGQADPKAGPVNSGMAFANQGLPEHLDSSMRDGPGADSDGEYDYGTAGYGEDDYNTPESSRPGVSVHSRGRNIPGARMLQINQSNNGSLSTAQSVSSVSSSNGYVPPTPVAENVHFGFDGGTTPGGSGAQGEGSEHPHDGQDGVSGSGGAGGNSAMSPTEPSRKKQKRNKPTLSCSECVERKTKPLV